MLPPQSIAHEGTRALGSVALATSERTERARDALLKLALISAADRVHAEPLFSNGVEQRTQALAGGSRTFLQRCLDRGRNAPAVHG